MSTRAYKQPYLSPLATFFLVFSLVGSACMLYYQLALLMPRVREVNAAKRLAGQYSFGNDFYPIWLTTRSRLRDLYSPDMTREIQVGLFGRPLDTRIPTDPPANYRTFAYPAFTDLLFWPTTKIRFPILRIVLACVLSGATGLAVLLWTKAMQWQPGPPWIAGTIILTLSSYPVLQGLYAEQLGLVVGFLLSACLVALARERYFLGGFLGALALIKPQMSVLEIGFLTLWTLSDWHRRKQFFIGLFSMQALLVLASLLVWPGWIGSWLHVVLAYHDYSDPPLLKEVVAQLLGPRASDLVGVSLIVGMLLAASALAWRHRSAPLDTSEFWLTSALLLNITTIALLPGQAIHDHVILLPAIFLVAKFQRALVRRTPIYSFVLSLAVLVGAWPWITAMALVVLRPIVSADLFYSKPIFSLPLRTSVVFPFVLLGLLVLHYRTRGQSNSSHLDSRPELRYS